MAIVIRFNTILALKSSVDKYFKGGLAAFRECASAELGIYLEDDTIVAQHSMNMFSSGWHQLAETDAVEGRDWTTADQFDENEPSSTGFSFSKCGHYWICWSKGDDPRFVVDTKDRRLAIRIAKAACASCSQILGIAPAVQAVDVGEYLRGPLTVISDNPVNNSEGLMAVCSLCGHHNIFDSAARLLVCSDSPKIDKPAAPAGKNTAQSQHQGLKLEGGADRTATFVYTGKQGELIVELYDHSSAAAEALGNDVAWLLTITREECLRLRSALGLECTGSREYSSSELIELIGEKFKDFHEIKDWLLARQIQFEETFDARA